MYILDRPIPETDILQMNQKEYNQCVDLHSKNVFRFIVKNIGDRDLASDIVQEAFIKLWEKHEEVDFEKAKSYLFTSAYHKMIDIIRRNKKTSDMDISDSVIESGLAQKTYSMQTFDTKKIIQDALEKLPEIQKHVVMLRDYEGYSYQEIGEITQLNESQVKVYIYRARLAMKNYLVSMDLVI